MGLDNPIHIAFLLIVLLLVFGAKRLPEMGRSLGGGMRSFKDAISGQESSQALTAVSTPTLTAAEQHGEPASQPSQATAAQASGA
jgi:sec-independent protein translocase protein TatA